MGVSQGQGKAAGWPPVLIVAGPTCSGKSALALNLAARLSGIVINADAMQSYRELRVLTARPTIADEARVPHALYGVRGAAEPATAAWWRAAALEVIGAAGRLPILCGGTGMYLDALLHGLAEIPDPGADARAEARALLAEHGAPDLHARLAAVDPATAARLRPSDGQRLARAWEVWRGTGRGLSSWQHRAAAPAPALRVRAILLEPDRAALRAAIAERWQAMLAQGAIEEVRGLLALGLDPALPLMRAHGVPELAAVLRGDLDLEQAGRRAMQSIGRYTRRQATWFRHHPVASVHDMFRIDARYLFETQQYADYMPAMMEFLSRAD